MLMRGGTWWIVILLLGIQVCAEEHASHSCIHDEQMDKFQESVSSDLTVEQTYDKNDELRTRRLAESSFKPMRIIFDVSKLSSDPGYLCKAAGDVVNNEGSEHTCSKDDVLTAAKREMLINVLLKEIELHFAKTLSVQPVSGNLVLQGLTCSESMTWACCSGSMPKYFEDPGVADTDFVLHVTARPTNGNTIAWALPCNVDQYGRPINGHANFGPAKIDTGSRARSEQIGTALHEMSHALGFSRSRFYAFRQPANGPKWGEENIFHRSTERGIHVTKLITPKIAEQVKKHFDCHNWVDAGAELENGATGSREFTSHFEKRVFSQEYMTATSSYAPVYSAITLALFEDSGWYIANYDTAEALPWGFHEGCGFVTSSCMNWPTSYFCSKPNKQHCTADYTSKGYCNLIQYEEELPYGFQYFSQPDYGGRNTYDDYCPTYRPYNNGDCRGVGRVSTYYDTNNGEEVGPSSRCFQSSLSAASSDRSSSPSCHTILGCSNIGLHLSVGGTKVTCPLEGGDISVDGYYGKLTCPVSNKICQLLQDKCSGSGALMPDGTCECNPGFVGEDCSGIQCPINADTNSVCSGSSQGTCNTALGECECQAAYTGLDCSQLVCPSHEGHKFYEECSSHGTCDRVEGECTCEDGYSGAACECVPGCHSLPENLRCTQNGQCDCTTGGCACDANFYGSECEINGAPLTTTLTIDGDPLDNEIVAEKEYKYYKVDLQSSSYDVTVVVEPTDPSHDPDLYASFDVEFPNSLTDRNILLSSNQESGRDEIHLCGSTGRFPRAVNDTFRYCDSVNSEYLEKTPGWLNIAVFGFKASTYSIRVEADKCKDENCSNHGTCGLRIAGVCSCDRLWSGTLCSVPHCRPDCLDDDIECEVDPETAELQSIGEINVGLRNTSQCYGNGECEVIQGMPTCVCDDSHSYAALANPSPNQELCKELIPSLSYIEHFQTNFSIHAEIANLRLDVDEWGIYTINVKPEWNVLHVNLTALSDKSDPMIFLRKGKLPSLNVYPATPIQHSDTIQWTQAGRNHQLLLARTASTLSDGVYYIAVYNSRYARNYMTYTLDVRGFEGSTCDNAICSGHGTCHSAEGSPVCVCEDGFAGEFCQIPIQHFSVAFGSSFDPSTQSKDVIQLDADVVHEGEWKYLSFDVVDTRARALKVEVLELRPNNGSELMPMPEPLVLFRDPSQNGFPHLDREAKTDFEAIQTGSTTQSIPFIITQSCTGINCYKVAIHNRKFAGDAYEFQIKVHLYLENNHVFDAQDCSNPDSNAMNCNGNGKCIDTPKGPTCECDAGLKGMDCNSPSTFDFQPLSYAAKTIELLCSVCNDTFSLKRNGLKIYRIPQPMKPNAGLHISVESGAGSNPNIYVSDILPRSVYDFNHVATSGESGIEVIQLTRSAFSGHYWIAVHSALDSSSGGFIQTEVTPEGRRLEDTNETTYSITASLFYIPETASNTILLTDRTFSEAVWNWMLHSPLGVAVLILAILFATSILSYCTWRSIYAPDNQDKVLKSLMTPGRTRRGSSLSREAKEELPDDDIVEVEANSSSEKRKHRGLRALMKKSNVSDSVELPNE